MSGRNDGYVDVVRGRRMERVEAFLTAQHAGNKILGNRRAHVPRRFARRRTWLGLGLG